MRKLMAITALCASAMSLTACQSLKSNDAAVDAAEPPVLTSKVMTVSGNKQALGDVFFQQVNGGVQVSGEIAGLNPGVTVAIHIHENGSCANMGKAAGGHFNPAKSNPHGNPDSDMSHAGDLPNITADDNGVAAFNYFKSDLSTNMTSPYSIYKRAVVIHDGPDDYTTQPAGASGPRVACGVIDTYS